LIKKFIYGLLYFVPCIAVDAVANLLSLNFPLDKAYLFQFPEVLGNSGLGQPDFGDDIVADAASLLAEVL